MKIHKIIALFTLFFIFTAISYYTFSKNTPDSKYFSQSKKKSPIAIIDSLAGVLGTKTLLAQGFSTNTISGRVTDENNKGSDNVTITLSGSDYRTTTTDSSGYYSFRYLYNGYYTVRMTTPAGYRATNGTSRSIDLFFGDEVANFRIAKAYTLSGSVFSDSNGNGVKDAGETGYAGATVAVSGDDSDSTQTDQNGNYSFSLLAGSYTVTLRSSSNYIITTQTSRSVSLNGNTSLPAFGARKIYTISGTVFKDVNLNSKFDSGEPTYPNSQVNLSGDKSASDTTDSNGRYSFTSLFSGDYTVATQLPPDFKNTTPLSQPVTITDQDKTIHFGRIPVYDLSGRVFIDGNANGVQDTGEAAMPNVTIVLTGDANSTKTTDSSGNYIYADFYEGDYTIAFTMPSGYRSTTPNSINIKLNANRTMNFGITKSTAQKIGGICTGISTDIVLVLDRSGSMGLSGSTGSSRMKEAREGAKIFVDIVKDNLPSARIGVVGFSDSDPGYDYYYPNSTRTKIFSPLTNNFTQVKKDIDNVVSYGTGQGGTCHECGVDLANQMLSGANRPDTQKVVVFLTDGNPTEIISSSREVATSTAENAAMNKVIAGVNQQNIIYSVIGMGLATASEYPLNEAFLQQIAATNGGFYYSNPTRGTLAQIYTDLADKLIGKGVINGTIFNDTNNNGALDPGEPPLPNWTVQLTTPSFSSPLTTTSDTNGTYKFDGLCTKSFKVEEVLKPGWTVTTASSYQLDVDNNTFNNINFGNRSAFTISGNVFLDLNKNGQKDAGESNYTGGITITASDGKPVTNSNGSYQITQLFPGQVTVSYPSLPSDAHMTYPLNGPPPSFSVTVGTACNTNGATSATCSGGNITNLNFGITDLSPWIQGTCADIAFDDGIDNPLPQNVSMMTTDTSCTNPGLLFIGDGSYSLGKGSISSTNWIVGGTTYPEIHTPPTSAGIFSAYKAMSARTKQAGMTPVDLATICVRSSCTLPGNLPSGVYMTEGDLVLNKHTFSANKNYVFLINGNLTIKGDISIPKGNGSSATFSASGNIFVDPSVGTTPSSSTSNLDGFYSADKSFIVQSTNACPDQRLNIAGAVIVNAGSSGGSFQNNRSLCSGDGTYPTVSFAQRLDILLNAPSFITQQVSFTTEVAP